MQVIYANLIYLYWTELRMNPETYIPSNSTTVQNQKSQDS